MMHHKKTEFLFLIIGLLFSLNISAQFIGGGGNIDLELNGKSPVFVGETETYELSGDFSGFLTTDWFTNVNYCTLISSNPTSCTVTFTAPSSNDNFITALVSDFFENQFIIPLKVDVLEDLNPGNIGGTQTICYGTSPSVLNSNAAATGGGGSNTYDYQWQYSLNGTNDWTSISGAIGESYNPSNNLTASHWYRRRVVSSGVTRYSNVIKVTVRNELFPNEISRSQTVCLNETPDAFNGLPAVGGDDINYSYQWQYSLNGTSGWTAISGATLLSYTAPSNLSANRWYRRRVISCEQTKYSNVVSITINLQEIRYYADTDNDGLGDPNMFIDACKQPNGYVANANDQCPSINSPTNICDANYEAINSITSESFDINGTTKSRSKAYFDELGKPIQTQSVDIETNKTWATQTLYDAQGRPALQTLSAPIRNTAAFEFKADFIQNSSGNNYSSSDFEDTTQDPSKVGTANNTLGNYYSTANDDDDYLGNSYMDITSYPFSNTVYSNLNPGTVLRTRGGNKINDEWPQTYSFSMRASQELAQTVAFGEAEYTTVKTLKTVVRDVHGNENVVFVDSDGKTLAAARSGEGVKRSMSIVINEQGYVDIQW